MTILAKHFLCVFFLININEPKGFVKNTVHIKPLLILLPVKKVCVQSA